MLPAPLSSCAGWWFTRLWGTLLVRRPERHTGWLITYSTPGELVLKPTGSRDSGLERIRGTLRTGNERSTTVTWEWPGEDGMLHDMQLGWQPGESIVRPIDWLRERRALPGGDMSQLSVPWPLRVAITVHGWHNQLLERAELIAQDSERPYAVHWEPPPGEPRLPVTELPCGITTLDRRGTESTPALILAGLTLPWRIDLDRDAWPVWQRLSASSVLSELGGPRDACPRHGATCPWPATGRLS